MESEDIEDIEDIEKEAGFGGCSLIDKELAKSTLVSSECNYIDKELGKEYTRF
jgi:hypothetical protein